MAIPENATSVTYRMSVTKNGAEVFNDLLTFPLHESPIQSVEQMHDRIQRLMDEYLADVKAAFHEDEGYTLSACRDYSARAIPGDPWPVD